MIPLQLITADVINNSRVSFMGKFYSLRYLMEKFHLAQQAQNQFCLSNPWLLCPICRVVVLPRHLLLPGHNRMRKILRRVES